MIKNTTLRYKSESLNKHGNWLKKSQNVVILRLYNPLTTYLDEKFELDV